MNKFEKSLKKAKRGGVVGELKHTIKHYHPEGKLSTKQEFEKGKNPKAK
jgi:hypothetical protein